MPRGRRPARSSRAIEAFADLKLNESTAGQPKYAVLRDYLAEEVASGRLKPEEALPPEVLLARSLGVARSTVRQAIAALEADGLVSRVQGKGTFIHKQARQRPKKGLDLFALVLPETETGFYPSLQRSFEAAAAQTHHQMLVCCTDNNVNKQADVILQLLDKQVGGVALVPTTAPTPPYQIRQLMRLGIPVVFCHRPVEGIEAPLLPIPFELVGRRAGEAFVSRGHRRVAFLSSQNSPATVAYETGLRQTLQAAGGTLPEHLVFRSVADPALRDSPEAELLALLERILAGEDAPTAIFASFDSLAELIYLLLTRLNRRVPEEISIIGVGGTVRKGVLQQRLSSVTVDEVRIGEQAAELLARMRSGELPLDALETHDIPISLYEGQTLGPAPALQHDTEPFPAERMAVGPAAHSGAEGPALESLSPVTVPRI